MPGIITGTVAYGLSGRFIIVSRAQPARWRWFRSMAASCFLMLRLFFLIGRALILFA